MDLIEVAASCEKSEIGPIGLLKGTANPSAVTIEGVCYEPGSLIFRGFVGVCDLKSEPKRWNGVYRFEPIPEGVEPPGVGDWSILNNDPPAKPKRAKKPAANRGSEVADGD